MEKILSGMLSGVSVCVGVFSEEEVGIVSMSGSVSVVGRMKASGER